jgi:hypothetical protein
MQRVEEDENKRTRNLTSLTGSTGSRNSEQKLCPILTEKQVQATTQIPSTVTLSKNQRSMILSARQIDAVN